MGKNKQFKKFRKAAKELPEMNTYGERLLKVKGSVLIEKGIVKNLKGEPIAEDRIYKALEKVPVPMDHMKNMKRNYRANGAAGVNHYIDAVKDHVAKQSEIKNDELPEPTSGVEERMHNSNS